MNCPIQSRTPPAAVTGEDCTTGQPDPLTQILNSCRQCSKCVVQCRLLQQHGPPGRIAEQHPVGSSQLQRIAYSCSLCNLCSQVCPLDLEPAAMFLDLRRQAVQGRSASLLRYARLLAYETLGTIRPFRYSHIPDNCTAIFFPGCALPGIRPQQTLQAYRLLRQHDPTLGIMLDCCNKPSHDLGRQHLFSNRMERRLRALQERGISEIITGCPNCHQAFSSSGGPLKVTSIYTRLASLDGSPRRNSSQLSTCTVHDPCSIRFEQEIQQSVRKLLSGAGIKLWEMEHNRANTLCCGEGGAAGCMGREYATSWATRRSREINGLPLVTYCAGCTQSLHTLGNVHHLLDVIFNEDTNAAAPAKVSTLQTYLNRISLRNVLKRLPSSGQ